MNENLNVNKLIKLHSLMKDNWSLLKDVQNYMHTQSSETQELYQEQIDTLIHDYLQTINLFSTVPFDYIVELAGLEFSPEMGDGAISMTPMNFDEFTIKMKSIFDDINIDENQ